MIGLLALFEHRAVFRKPRRARLAQDFAELVDAKAREQRQMGNQRRVDCGHVSQVGSAVSTESRLRLWPTIKREVCAGATSAVPAAL